MILRKPAFWALLCLVTAGCAYFTARHFSDAFSIVNIDLRMDRAAALREARLLAAARGWAPANPRQAAAFGLDAPLRDFVELDAGGKEVFNRIVREGNVFPYTWRVRHFREGEERETSVYFTPEGRPAGFSVRIPEQAPGNNLPQPAARALAEKAAAADWDVRLGSYTIVEQSSEKRLGGRVDHLFVYEKQGESLGEGRYRIRLAVSGDRLTGLSRYVKIPESFSLRYRKMRSANNTIASAAGVAAGLVYVLGGCIIALLVLLPRNWIQWRTPLAVGAAVAFLQLLAAANALPLEWLSYDTAISRQAFLLQQLTGYAQAFIFDGLLLALSFLAAENLTRRAFPDHIRLWKLWSREAASSPQVAGQTAAGYLLTAAFLAYEVVLFFMTRHLPNWWAPSDIVYDPNILAMYLPWLTPFAAALHAGFWEECLFRAVPLACAALIGERLGNRRAWIIGALLLQAVLFGAAHANYPNQPSYARIVEIIPPSIGFGLLYIFFGLLPAIILHFSFDAVMMSLPLFVSHAPGSRLDQALFLLLFLIPLWVVLFNRLKAGAWRPADGPLLNRYWRPAPPEEAPPAAPEESALPSSPLARRILAGLIPAGLIIIACSMPFAPDVPGIRVPRSRALLAGRAELNARGIRLPAEWKAFAIAAAEQPDKSDRFVWREGGDRAFGSLLRAGYLSAPSWHVRFARFGGSVSERSEEYHVVVDGSGHVAEYAHDLPEDRPSPSMDEAQARDAARAALRSLPGLDPAKLAEITAQPSKQPKRTDWHFAFQDPEHYPLKQGQARISVSFAGDELTNISKHVYVPDEWQRKDRERTAILGVIGAVSGILHSCLFLAGAVFAVVGWARKRFSPRIFFAAFAALVLLQLAQLANYWPKISFTLSPVEPLANQLLTLVGIGGMTVIFAGGAVALVYARTLAWLRTIRRDAVGSPLAGAAGWACAFTAFMSTAYALLPAAGPLYPEFAEADARFPALGILLSSLIFFAKRTTLILLLTAAAGKFTARWTRRRTVAAVLFLLLGLVFAGHAGPDSWSAWLVEGTLTGLALILGYRFLFRYTYAAVPPAIGAMVILGSIQQIAFRAFPGAVAGHVIAIAAVGLISYFWFRWLERD